MDDLYNQGEEVDITEEQYSFSDEEEDEVIMKQTNNKEGDVLNTIKSKLKIIQYVKEHSQKNTSIKFGIPPTTIHDWMKKELSFLNIPSNTLNKKTLNTEKDILCPDVEIKSINFIEFNHKRLNPISTWSLLLKLYSLIPERKKLQKKNKSNVYL